MNDVRERWTHTRVYCVYKYTSGMMGEKENWHNINPDKRHKQHVTNYIYTRAGEKKRELIIHASKESYGKGKRNWSPGKNPINYTGSAHAHATQAQNDSMLTPYIKLLIHLMNSHSFASALAALKWSTHIVIHRIVSVCVLSAPTIKKKQGSI